MAKIRKYSYDTIGIITCWIYHDSQAIAQFIYDIPEKLRINPRYEFRNFGIMTLGEYNYEVFLFIRRVSKILADGSLKKYRSEFGKEVEFDFPSEDALF